MSFSVFVRRLSAIFLQQVSAFIQNEKSTLVFSFPKHCFLTKIRHDENDGAACRSYNCSCYDLNRLRLQSKIFDMISHHLVKIDFLLMDLKEN
jgi:hypothetical protein